jgi:beta-galactosidase GanA
MRVLWLLAVFAFALGATPRAHTVTYDAHSLLIDGKHVYVWSGEFHYYRLPSPDAWRDVLEKIHAAGFNAVSLYFDWAYHSPAPGKYDFTGVRDVDKLLTIASQVGLYVIVRPGPYINAELDSGGFPGWLQNLKGAARTTAPDYLDAALDWLGHIDAIIARHQLTNGTGTVILYQVENEYGGDDVDREYMAALERKVRADGITVPLVHNSCCGDQGRWANGVGAVDINGYDEYPQGFNCTQPSSWASLPERSLARAQKVIGDKPLLLLEYQGGSFDGWGGPGYAACRELTGPKFERVFEEFNIAAGAKLQNFYMTYGGTTWGWMADPSAVYTSYDYAAIIDEARRLTAKYSAQKLLANEVRTLWPLTTADGEAPPPISNPALHVDARFDAGSKTQFFIVRHRNVASTLDDRGTFAATIDGRHYTIPVEIDGRDSKLIVAGLPLGDARLVYSTSELAAVSHLGDRDVALLYGRNGEDGETVVRFRDGTERVLRYVNRGLTRIRLRPRGRNERPLELLVASDEAAARFWPVRTDAGTVLVRGPYLVRGAAVTANSIALRGDTTTPTRLEVFAPARIARLRWNGAEIAVQRTPDGTLQASLPGPKPVTLPALSEWRTTPGSPESDPTFDDRNWVAADRGTLYVDPYDFHYGDVWYRGRFTGNGADKSATIDAMTDVAGAFTVWLNGTYLGSKEADTNTGEAKDTFNFPPGTLHPNAENVIAVLVENSGHEEDGTRDDYYKSPRGIKSVKVDGSPTSIAWRIQGNLENDPTRGPMNTGGQYGERSGWYLPDFPDARWALLDQTPVADPPGITWHRTTFDLHVPSDQDAAVALHIDDTNNRNYRALIYLNGWLVGRYINDIGPENTFVLPNGILHTNGTNSLAISVWRLDPETGTLPVISLKLLSNTLTPTGIDDVKSPTYFKGTACSLRRSTG